MAKFENNGRPIINVGTHTVYYAALKPDGSTEVQPLVFKFEVGGTGDTVDLATADDLLTSFELEMDKPDVTLRYNGRIVDPLWDMFFPPSEDE
jgi:hypothetical protein